MILNDEIIFCTNHIAQKLNPYGREDGDSYVNICELLSRMAGTSRGTGIDRSGTLVTRYKYKILGPIPEIPQTFTKTFKDICFERAQELVDLNKPITVMWSGGIDSTAALVTLMQVASPGQLTITFQDRSIIEYPWFFVHHVKKYPYKIMDHATSRYEPQHGEIVVTGNHCDQLFTNFGLLLNYFDLKDEPWTEIFDYPNLFNKRKYRLQILAKKSVRNYLREHVQPFLDKSPREIKTAMDFYWWLNFNITWQPELFSIHSLAPFVTKNRYTSIYNFYNTTDFQLWSITNPDLKVKDTLSTYKYVVKDIIYEFTGDDDYYDNKIKERSGIFTMSMDQEYNSIGKLMKHIKDGDIPSIVDSNFNNFYYQSILDNPDDFKKIMNPIPDAILNKEVLYDDNWINWRDMP